MYFTTLFLLLVQLVVGDTASDGFIPTLQCRTPHLESHLAMDPHKALKRASLREHSI